MYTKEELEQMEDAQLLGIAKELGAAFSQDDSRENVVYAILDKAAEQGATGDSTAKRKRTRIKKDTDRVYTVKGSEGENFDAKSRSKKAQEPVPSLFSDIPAETPTESEQSAVEPIAEPAPPAPKKRGRKSKAELAAAAAAAEAAAAAAVEAAAAPVAQEAAPESSVEPAVPEAAEPQEVAEAPAPATDDIPEAQFATGDNSEGDDNGLLEQLQAKMAQRNQEEDKKKSLPDGVWEGDPGDGTDFIIVEDLPIEDQEAIPSLDIFDRPVVHPVQEQPVMMPKSQQTNTEKYNFQDIIDGNGVMEVLQDGYGFVRSPTTTTSRRPTTSTSRHSKSRSGDSRPATWSTAPSARHTTTRSTSHSPTSPASMAAIRPKCVTVWPSST